MAGRTWIHWHNSSMNVGYRRWSECIGLTENERYSKSGWHEKRLALSRALRERGHQVLWLSTPTRASRGEYSKEQNLGQKIDILLVEASNMNLFFHYEDIKETIDLMERAECPVVLLYDDPAYQIKLGNKTPGTLGKPNLHMARPFDIWVNTLDIESACFFLKERLFYRGYEDSFPEVRVETFPVSGLLSYPEKSSAFARASAAYIGGTSGGRGSLIGELPNGLISVLPREGGQRVRQTQRVSRYSEHVAALGLADKTHKKLGWHTGRIFQALCGGVPVFVEKDNPLVDNFLPLGVDTYSQVMQNLLQSPATREDAYQRSRGFALSLRPLVDKLLSSYGL